MDDEELKIYGYIISSSYRVRTMKSLTEEKTPSQVAQDSDIRLNHISKVLKELKSCQVAECINEQDRKNRIYRLTPLGEKITSNLK